VVSKRKKSFFTHHILGAGGGSKMIEPKTFIRLQNRNPNRPELLYATLCTPQRKDKIKINNEKWLGRVIDLDKRVFYKKDIGYYILTKENTSISLLNDELTFYQNLDKDINVKTGFKKLEKSEKNKHIVDFGATYVLYKYIEDNNLDTFLNFKSPQEKHTINSLILYRIIEKNGYSFAKEWWDNNYIKYILPYAKLQSQRISELLTRMGSESYFRSFFSNYFNYIKSFNLKNNILIDSTGLPDSIKCHYTAINNHNGIISNEIRLISVIDKISGFPIYFRYVPGNIVDVSTLKRTIFELQEYGLNIDRLVLDAGYYSVDNIRELYDSNITFMARMAPRYSIYNLLIKKHAPNIINRANYVLYGERSLYIKKDQINICNGEIPVFAYICYDEEKKHIEYKDYMNKFRPNDITDEIFELDIQKMGIFIIITTIELSIHEVLPRYYTRQSVEQFFDYIKNYIDLLPLRTHSEESFSGHLLLSFMATVIYYSIDKKLKEKGISLINGMNSLKLLHARVYNNKLLPSPPTKRVNDILKALKINLPDKIEI
jgi:transposase